MNTKDTKKLLDELDKKYEIREFICSDPVQFPHRYKDSRDQELAGIIASAFAYGKREKIVHTVDYILKLMHNDPYNFVLNFNYDKDHVIFHNFKYRYNTGRDLGLLIYSLNRAINEYKCLKNLFLEGYSDDDKNIREALTHFSGSLRAYLRGKENFKGVYYLLSSPEQGSACKRMNMFLRWMARPAPVDLGIWSEISTEKLIIPLDTHVAKLSRKLHLTSRASDDWKTAEEITERLKEFDPNDPVKYDFAIFGMGITGDLPACVL